MKMQENQASPESATAQPPSRPVSFVFDFSKYLDYMVAQGPSGIARVDLAYAKFLSENPQLLAAGVHDRLHIYTRFSAATLKNLTHDIEREWRESDEGEELAQVSSWLRSEAPTLRRVGNSAQPRRERLGKILSIARGWPYFNPFSRMPKGSIYLNTAYANLKHPRYLNWLARRPDMRGVFMVHDLIPLEHPEWFWEGIEQNFATQMNMILRHAHLVVVPSEVVARQVRALASARGRPDLQVKAIALPPADVFLSHVPPLDRGKTPYFVMCGTLEPRKNHLLLFRIWRDLVRTLPVPPRLLVVGGRGWRHDEITCQLETDPDLAGHVLEVSRLSTHALGRVVRGAQALLMPSRDEGFGLPIAEALAAGIPVVASDIPVLREASQGCALHVDMADARAWQEAIVALAYDPAVQAAACKRAEGFIPMTWPSYFKTLLEAVQCVASATPSSRIM